jgi:hypothetical protein
MRRSGFNMLFILMFIFIALQLPVFACAMEKPPMDPPTQIQSQFTTIGPVTNDNKNTNTNNNTNNNTNYNTNLNTSINTNTNTVTANPKAKSNASSDSSANGVVDTSIQYNNPRQAMAAPTTFSEPIPLLMNGSVGDVTESMPAFRGIKKLSKTDVITGILGVYKGNIFNRIRYEDIETEVLTDYAKIQTSDPGSIRYTVKFKGSVQGAGTSGGLSGALGGVSSVASASLLPGINRSTYDPMFFITFYTVVSTLR